MKMFLTRLGFGSKMVVTGDVTQIDLPSGTKSGLKIVQDILDGIEDVHFCRLTSQDVVRHRTEAARPRLFPTRIPDDEEFRRAGHLVEGGSRCAAHDAAADRDSRLTVAGSGHGGCEKAACLVVAPQLPVAPLVIALQLDRNREAGRADGDELAVVVAGQVRREVESSEAGRSG